MQKGILTLLLFIITGCSSSIIQLQRATPTGSPFQKYLTQEYLDFSVAEAQQYDWYDAGYFARKGLKTAKGIDMPPENIEYWDISGDAMPIISQARGFLMQTLSPEVKEKYPEDAAKAQFLFDCWVEQEEELWQKSHVAYCRENFYKRLDKLYEYIAADKAIKMAELAKTATVLAEKPKKEVDFSGGEHKKEQRQFSFVEEEEADSACPDGCLKIIEKRTVYFAIGSSKLSKRTKLVAQKLIKGLKTAKKYKITLNGYADRVGKEDYNMRLSKKRALAIKTALIKAGIDKDSIVVFAFGEVHGLLDTEDGVPEQENRAVEIAIER